MQDGRATDERILSVIIENINKALSHNKEIRECAEKTLKSFEISPGYGSSMVGLVLRRDLDPATRQMACVLLRQYVEVHWSQLSDKFESFTVDPMEKSYIRDSLLVGLKEPLKNIRSGIAYIVSLIASWDWPDEWPRLFEVLISGLSSQEGDFVHGVMRVLTEFCRDVSASQADIILPALFPHLIHILLNHQNYSLRTRSRCVNIFTTCTNLISNMQAVNKGAAKKHLLPHLPSYLDAFQTLLQTTDDAVVDRGLKAEILNALTCLMTSFPSSIKTHMTSILTCVWQVLTNTAFMYTEEIVNNTETMEDAVDSDCELMGYGGVTEALFEFIQALLDMNHFKWKVKSSSENLFKFIILFLQVTNEQLERWMEDGQEWQAEEEEGSFKHSTRISARELLCSIFELFPCNSTSALHSCALQMFADADHKRMNNDANWWKLYEATLLAIGVNSKVVLQNNSNQNANFDITSLINGVVFPLLNQDVPVLLHGRLLWVASRFSCVLDKTALELVLQKTLSCFSAEKEVFLQLQALRCIQLHSTHLSNKHDDTQWLGEYVEQMVRIVVSMASKDDPNVLETCLQTLCHLLEVDEKATGKVGKECMDLAIAVFNTYNKNVAMLSLCQDVLSLLAGNKDCTQHLQQSLLPMIANILQLPTDDDHYGTQSICMELLTCLVRNSSVPLPSLLLSYAFPVVVSCINNTPDFSTLENGADCIRAYVSKDAQSILHWRDSEGRTSGLAEVMRVVERLLQPKTPEYTTSFAGRLIIVLLARLGDALGGQVGVLLKAVLIKLTLTETSTATQSLVLVFAHLMHTQMMPVLDFLSSLPGPSGAPALEFVLEEWTAKQHLFIGDYERKVSAVALSKLLQFSVESNDERMQKIMVQGEQLTGKQNVIRTRRKAAIEPERWTRIPVLVKMYKLLINELSNQIELDNTKATKLNENEEEEDDDDDDEEASDDNDEEYSGNIFEDLADYEVDGEDVMNDDDDFKEDPIYNINLQEYLVSFLQSLSQQPFFPFFSEHHNEAEIAVLNSVNIRV